MKRIFSIIIAVLILTSVVALPTTVSAATNDANSFKSGKFVKCGGYYFFVNANKNGKSTLYRVNSAGKKKKAISNINFCSNDNLLSYKNRIYFNDNKGVMCYIPKSNKKFYLKKGKYESVGICNKGIISSDYNTGLTLIRFNKKVKKINSYSNSYMCSNSKYIFYYSTKEVGSKYKITIKRFNLSKNKSKTASTLTIKKYGHSTISCTASHVFKKNIIFSVGSYEGTGLYYNGVVYKMNSIGAGIKKILNSSVDKFTPGKDCVYGMGQPSYDQNIYECYKITSNGKCKKVKNISNLRESTSNDYCIYASRYNKLSENMYICKVANSKSKKIFNGASFIRSSDPVNAYVNGIGVGSYGDMALIEIRVFSPTGGMGWRPLLLRTYTYMVNLKTGSKVLLSTVKY